MGKRSAYYPQAGTNPSWERQNITQGKMINCFHLVFNMTYRSLKFQIGEEGVINISVGPYTAGVLGVETGHTFLGKFRRGTCKQKDPEQGWR